MSRFRRERSPAAEYEVDLHSPARRKYRPIRPAHAHYNTRCTHYDSPDDSPDSSSSDEDSPQPDADSVEIVFADAPSPSPKSPSATEGAHNDASPPPSSPTEASTRAHTPPLPRPEPIADRLRRMAREGRAKARAAQDGMLAATEPSRADILARSEALIRSDPELRALAEGGRYGVYVDSTNPKLIRVVDAAPDTDDSMLR